MPIRPESPEDFEEFTHTLRKKKNGDVNVMKAGGYLLGTIHTSALDLLFKEYVLPGVAKAVMATTPFSNRMAIEAFGHPWGEIRPEFWLWRRLTDVPRESDQCPWV